MKNQDQSRKVYKYIYDFTNNYYLLLIYLFICARFADIATDCPGKRCSNSDSIYWLQCKVCEVLEIEHP